MIEIYTDGGFKAPKGAWALVAISPATMEKNDSVVYTASGVIHNNVTSQRAELLAGIEAVDWFDWNKHYRKALIVSDSQYLIKGMTEWILRWRSNGWRSSQRRQIENLDLWQQLVRASYNANIEWKWVRGHNGDKWNEYVDNLVCNALN